VHRVLLLVKIEESTSFSKSSIEDARGSKSLERLLSLSDCVFAFAITVLALDLVTPVIVGQASNAALGAALVNEFHSFLGFFVGFWVIGLLWLSHHRLFRYIKTSDAGLLWLNLVLLFFVVLIPFAVRVLNYGYYPIALDVYASILIGTFIMYSIIWRYASHPNRNLLDDERISPKTRTWLSFRGFFAASIFVLSLFLAYVDPYVTLASWLSVLPLLVYLDRKYR